MILKMTALNCPLVTKLKYAAKKVSMITSA